MHAHTSNSRHANEEETPLDEPWPSSWHIHANTTFPVLYLLRQWRKRPPMRNTPKRTTAKILIYSWAVEKKTSRPSLYSCKRHKKKTTKRAKQAKWFVGMPIWTVTQGHTALQMIPCSLSLPGHPRNCCGTSTRVPHIFRSGYVDRGIRVSFFLSFLFVYHLIE
jgi:hypothetical protein